MCSVLHGIGRDSGFGKCRGLWRAEETFPRKGVELRTAVNRVQKKTKWLHNNVIVVVAVDLFMFVWLCFLARFICAPGLGRFRHTLGALLDRHQL